MLKKSFYASAVLIATLLIPALIPEDANAYYYYRSAGFSRGYGGYRSFGYGGYRGGYRYGRFYR